MESDSEFFNSVNIDYKRIAHRYIIILEKIQKFIKKDNIENNVEFNFRLLKSAIIDYFVDIARVKKFHGIQIINPEKIYAYTAYWLLKRKPLQIKIPYNGCEFVNEKFITSYMMSVISAEKDVTKLWENNPTMKTFQSLLFYNLKYRHVSQQSLELMIEAFFCGCDFHAGANTPKLA